MGVAVSLLLVTLTGWTILDPIIGIVLARKRRAKYCVSLNYSKGDILKFMIFVPDDPARKNTWTWIHARLKLYGCSFVGTPAFTSILLGP
ncbi:hypothetical protein [Paenibacillus agricola]|uniref:hypothetical protein n=1 Tax=Paenibacillus agricola TaxID=2716264 RepID=UPI002441618E|nr:hypothetical protein [Paenibacillus agricola]